jgi:hypothetical protein
VFKGIARLIVATAAGAGLGAGAALARRHLVGGGAVPLASSAPWAADVSSMPYAPEPTEAPLPGPARTAMPEPVAAPPAAPEPTPPTQAPSDVADLDTARARLRERAAALRAEMEG